MVALLLGDGLSFFSPFHLSFGLRATPSYTHTHLFYNAVPLFSGSHGQAKAHPGSWGAFPLRRTSCSCLEVFVEKKVDVYFMKWHTVDEFYCVSFVKMVKYLYLLYFLCRLTIIALRCCPNVHHPEWKHGVCFLCDNGLSMWMWWLCVDSPSLPPPKNIMLTSCSFLCCMSKNDFYVPSVKVKILAVGCLSGPCLHRDPTKDLCKWKEKKKNGMFCLNVHDRNIWLEKYKLTFWCQSLWICSLLVLGNLFSKFCPLDVILELFVLKSVIDVCSFVPSTKEMWFLSMPEFCPVFVPHLYTSFSSDQDAKSGLLSFQ